MRLQSRLATRVLQIPQGAAPTEAFCSRAKASFPYTNSRRPVSSRFFSSRFLIRSRRVATMFCLDARSRSREGDAGGGTPVVALRDRMIRPRSSSWLYNQAVETPACVATVRKLICRSEASIRCKAAKARCITLSLRSRALRVRPSVFLGMCSLQ